MDYLEIKYVAVTPEGTRKEYKLCNPTVSDCEAMVDILEEALQLGRITEWHTE